MAKMNRSDADQKATKRAAVQRVIVFSGGLDSLVNAYSAIRLKQKVRLFYVDFGKPASLREKAAAKRVAALLNLPLEVFPFHSLVDLQNGYVDPAAVALDEADIKDAEIFSEYGPHVSGYHLILSLASYYAQIIGFSGMTVGLIKDQADRLPGLPDAIKAFSKHISLLNPALGAFTIDTPLIAHNKRKLFRPDWPWGSVRSVVELSQRGRDALWHLLAMR